MTDPTKNPIQKASRPLSDVERIEQRTRAERRVRAQLWQAVWEADQFMTSDGIRGLVERTLGEIEGDRP